MDLKQHFRTNINLALPVMMSQFGQVMVGVADNMMVGQVGYDLRLMMLIEKHKLSYILKSTNANSITMVFWEKDIHRECGPAQRPK